MPKPIRLIKYPYKFLMSNVLNFYSSRSFVPHSLTNHIPSFQSSPMVDLSWAFGHAKTSYTHHAGSVKLLTKSGTETTLADLVKSCTPPCRLNPLLFNGHLQTMWTAVKDDGPPIYYKRKVYESSHSVYPGEFTVDFVISKEKGQKCDVDTRLPVRTTFFNEEEWKTLGSLDDRPMLVCLHGLSGGSHEVYLRQCVAPIMALGWETCVVNSRGCAMSRITSPRLFNARATWVRS